MNASHSDRTDTIQWIFKHNEDQQRSRARHAVVLNQRVRKKAAAPCRCRLNDSHRGKTTTIRTLLVTPSKITPTAWWHGGKCSKKSGRKVNCVTENSNQWLWMVMVKWGCNNGTEDTQICAAWWKWWMVIPVWDKEELSEAKWRSHMK